MPESNNPDAGPSGPSGQHHESQARVAQSNTSKKAGTSFTKVLSASYVNGAGLSIPAEFAKYYLHTSETWNLTTDEGAWPVSINLRMCGRAWKADICAGWNKFRADSKFKVGDEIQVEYVRPGILKVQKLRSNVPIRQRATPPMRKTESPKYKLGSPSEDEEADRDQDKPRKKRKRRKRVSKSYNADEEEDEDYDDEGPVDPNWSRQFIAQQAHHHHHYPQKQDNPNTQLHFPTNYDAYDVSQRTKRSSPGGAGAGAASGEGAPGSGGSSRGGQGAPPTSPLNAALEMCNFFRSHPQAFVGQPVLIGPPYSSWYCLGTIAAMGHFEQGILYNVRYTDSIVANRIQQDGVLKTESVSKSVNMSQQAAMAAHIAVAPGMFVGSGIIKEFQGRKYQGKVLGYSSINMTYHMMYEHGCIEELRAEETLPLLSNMPSSWEEACATYRQVASATAHTQPQLHLAPPDGTSTPLMRDTLIASSSADGGGQLPAAAGVVGTQVAAVAVHQQPQQAQQPFVNEVVREQYPGLPVLEELDPEILGELLFLFGDGL